MIKTLAASIRQFKKQSLLAPIFVSLEVVVEVFIPLLMASLIDQGIKAQNPAIIWRIGLAMLAMCLLSLGLGVMSGRYSAIASAGFAANLRQDLYYKVQDFSFGNIEHFSSAGVVTRLTTDVANVQNAYMMIIRVAVRAPVMLVLALIMASRINPELALIFLCAVPVLGVGFYLIIRFAHPIFDRVFHTYDKLNNVVQENLRGIRVVKSFTRESYETNKFGDVSQDIYADFSKAEKIIAFNAPLMQICVYGCLMLIGWFGAKLVVGSALTTGELMSMFTYTMLILTSLMMLSIVFVMILIARTSAERICQLLNETPSISSPPQPLTTVADGSVEFKKVSFSYKGTDRYCLRDVDLTIPSGATVGILGGTGSSKSTLVQLIPRLYDCTAGQVLVGGYDVRDYDLDALRSAVAMVLQKNVLFSGTIKENLRWGKEDATDEELIQACRLAEAHDFISSFPDGYDTYIEQGGANVSGGQRQRLCIARALLKQPKILILDDSTSAVDTATDARIRASFRQDIPQVTKFIIAQRVASVQDADIILVMEGGRVAAVGTHQQLLANQPIYREVYESQMKGGAEDDPE